MEHVKLSFPALLWSMDRVRVRPRVRPWPGGVKGQQRVMQTVVFLEGHLAVE